MQLSWLADDAQPGPAGSDPGSVPVQGGAALGVITSPPEAALKFPTGEPEEDAAAPENHVPPPSKSCCLCCSLLM